MDTYYEQSLFWMFHEDYLISLENEYMKARAKKETFNQPTEQKLKEKCYSLSMCNWHQNPTPTALQVNSLRDAAVILNQ